jgi:hypothetical protein
MKNRNKLAIWFSGILALIFAVIAVVLVILALTYFVRVMTP